MTALIVVVVLFSSVPLLIWWDRFLDRCAERRDRRRGLRSLAMLNHPCQRQAAR